MFLIIKRLNKVKDHHRKQNLDLPDGLVFFNLALLVVFGLASMQVFLVLPDGLVVFGFANMQVVFGLDLSDRLVVFGLV